MNALFLLSLDQQGKKITLDQNGKLDIYIALDVSDSIDKEDFDKAKETVKLLIEKVCPPEVDVIKLKPLIF